MTNATKAQIIAAVNALLTLAMAFGLPISTEESAAVVVVVNMALGAYVAATYKNSKKRVPDA